jgi:membrane protease YdiL (CAAX protease family)
MSIKFKKPLLLMVCFLEFSIISCEIVGLNYEKSTKGIANADAISFYTLHNLAEIAASVLPFLFILSKKDALLKLDISRVLCFEKVKRKKLFSLVMVGLFICFFANQVSNVLLQNLSLLGITCKLPNLPEVNKDPVRIVLYLIMISVSPALVEEFVFRGVILGSLRKFGNFFAIISSSILFGVVHSNAVQIPFAFVVGLILGMILVETNSMLPGILIHFLNNLFSCLDSIISEYNEEISQEFMTFRWMTVLILSIFAFRYILSIRPTLFEFDRNSHALFSTKKSMKIFFLSKGMIVVLLIFFLFTLSTVSLA